MKDENVHEMEKTIKKCNVNKNIKEELLFLSECLEKITSMKNKIAYSIIIDNMPKDEMSKYLREIKNILGKDNVFKKITGYMSLKELERKSNKIFIMDFDDDDLSDRIKDEEDYLRKYINASLMNNNILIMTSYKPIEKVRSFKKFNIENTYPCVCLHGKISEERVYDKLIRKYKSNKINYQLSREEFHKIFVQVIEMEEMKSLDFTSYIFNYSISKMIFNNKDIIDIHTFDELVKKEIKDSKKEEIDLKKIVGLSNVKKELNSLFNYASFIKKTNINQNETYLNMFFLGNPGTGKTMVANVIANRLYEMGYLKDSEIVKVVPTDLIGEYVGQTKNAIRKILDNAKGKLLFIDEAYLLYNNNYKNGNNPFMEEAIVELLKYLENPENIVIMAGYKDEMQRIYKANPGIKSRIYKEIIFDDYNEKELYQILNNDLEKKGLKIDIDAKKNIINYIKTIKRDKDFGNARSMIQLSQKLIINHANQRLKKDNYIITNIDIPKYEKVINKKMGFGE